MILLSIFFFPIIITGVAVAPKLLLLLHDWPPFVFFQRSQKRKSNEQRTQTWCKFMKPVNHKPAFPLLPISCLNTTMKQRLCSHKVAANDTWDVSPEMCQWTCLFIIQTVLSNPDSWPSYILCFVNITHDVSLYNFHEIFITLYGQTKPRSLSGVRAGVWMKVTGWMLAPAVTHCPKWTCTYTSGSSCGWTPRVPLFHSIYSGASFSWALWNNAGHQVRECGVARRWGLIVMFNQKLIFSYNFSVL